MTPVVEYYYKSSNQLDLWTDKGVWGTRSFDYIVRISGKFFLERDKRRTIIPSQATAQREVRDQTLILVRRMPLTDKFILGGAL